MVSRFLLAKSLICGIPFHKDSKQFICSSRIIRSRSKNIFFKDMPKNNSTSAELKEQRLKSKTSSLKKVVLAPSEIYLCVLGNGAKYCSRALYMFTDHGRYLFNCGEGTQRLAHEYKMKLSKLEHIFITHKSWYNLGGLLGLSLTIQDMGVSEINLHGPDSTDVLFENAESFITTKNLKVVSKTNLENGFVDGCMQITYIPIYPILPKIVKKHEITEPRTKRLCYDNTPKAVLESDMIVAYACKGHSKPGQLLLEKCVEQGVPPGPLLGDLKNGKDIVLACGRTVYSKDVVSAEQPCPVFLVVECPSKYYLENFVTEEKFKEYQSCAPASCLAALVVHFTPPEILKKAKYQEWMKKFPDSTYHLIINSDNATIASSAIHRIQQKLHLIHPEIFPLLCEKEAEPLDEFQQENVIQANTLDRFLLRPAKGLDRSLAVNVDPQVFIDEAMKTEGFKDCLEDLKICIQENSDLSPYYGNPFPDVMFLGTGSCIPSKVRNVSAILVRTCSGLSPSKFEYFLMDCGEGTCGQLMRMLGDQYNFALKHCLGVFISHMHADHHLGLIGVLKAREKAYGKTVFMPLLVIGPTKLKTWLENYNENFEKIASLYSFVDCSTLEYNYGNYKEDGEIARYSFFDLSISTVRVHHCHDAYGLIMSDKFLNWKSVYSGDTTPCDRLVTAGKDCTLLIHEATMEDELEDEARIKRHSTTSQAVEISEKMNAKHTILTHFSQRYAKVPLITENFTNQIGCAFDNMRVSKKELPILPLLVPALQCLFAENVQELKLKGDKRRKKQELMSQIIVN